MQKFVNNRPSVLHRRVFACIIYMRQITNQPQFNQGTLTMFRTENTPTRARTVLEDIYAKAGQPDFQFKIPQPFTVEHIAGVEAVGANPSGVVAQLNQVLAENLCNNMAARVRNAAKNGQPLPTQADMDTLYTVYDFSGIRQPGGSAPTSLFDRIFARLAGAFVKKLLKKKGYQSLPAPVTVAKRDEAPTAGQISFEDFEAEVSKLVSGDGPWGEVEAFANVRESLIEDARTEEAAVRAREVAAENKLAGLGL